MYKLHYFNFYGRAEPIRMLLTHANIAFEDIRVPFPDWPGVKGNYEFGQLPVLEITDAEGKVKKYAQTLSILRYLSIQNGYYPKDNAEQAWEIDSTLDAIYDLVNGLVKIYWEKDLERKAQLSKDFFSGPYTQTLKALAKRLVENNTKYIAGDKITAADFLFGHFIFSVILNDLREVGGDVDYLKTIFKQFEALVKYADTFRAEFAEYLETRAKCPR